MEYASIGKCSIQRQFRCHGCCFNSVQYKNAFLNYPENKLVKLGLMWELDYNHVDDMVVEQMLVTTEGINALFYSL